MIEEIKTEVAFLIGCGTEEVSLDLLKAIFDYSGESSVNLSNVRHQLGLIIDEIENA